jgi:hypothetical protein
MVPWDFKSILTSTKGASGMQYKIGLFMMAIAMYAGSLLADNLFSVNSGFETTTNPWNLYKQDTSVTATMSLDSTDSVISGKKYLKVEVTKVNPDKSKNWYIQLQDPTWVAKINYQYTFSCWAKADSTGRSIHIAAQGKEGDEFAYRSGMDFSLDTVWAPYHYTYTSDVSGVKAMHFFVYLGYSTGVYSFDSMSLDSMNALPPDDGVINRLAYSNPFQKMNYNLQVMPACIRLIAENSAAPVNNVAVYSLEGRLVSSYTVPAATRVFEMPKPSSGAWVVGVNATKKVIQVP